MEFKEGKPIYVQIAERLVDEILVGKYKKGERIPSVREYSVLLEVNVNTTVKAYDLLAQRKIIFNRRGLGYYVSERAYEIIICYRKKEFCEEFLPYLFEQMDLLGLKMQDLVKAWKEKTK